MVTRKKHNASVTSMADALINKKLATSCLDAKDRKHMLVAPADPAELEAAGQTVGLAMEIPYFDIDGQPNGFKRWRYLESTKDGFAAQTDAKDKRYVQPPNTLPQAYFPPHWDWRLAAEDATIDLFITEGELKAACCCKFDRPTVGLGGVWSFQSKKASKQLIDELRQFAWTDRRVTIVFDSDAATNTGVSKASNALAAELLLLGARVLVVYVPAAEDGTKQGIDDYCLAEGAEALRKLVDRGVQYEASQVLHRMNEEVAFIRDPGIIHVHATGQ